MTPPGCTSILHVSACALAVAQSYDCAMSVRCDRGIAQHHTLGSLFDDLGYGLWLGKEHHMRRITDAHLWSPDLPKTRGNATASSGTGRTCLSVDRVLFQSSGSRMAPVERRRAVQFKVRAVAVASDPEALQGFLLEGVGLFMTNHVRVKSDVAAGRLVRVLPRVGGPEPTLYAIRPGGRVQPPKFKAFLDFLIPRLDLKMIDSKASHI